MQAEATRRGYFEDLAARWDGFTDGARVQSALEQLLRGVPFGPGDNILDLGCGTGNLTAVLVRLLGPSATVTAVDFAAAMIDAARSKVPDPRVRWIVADVSSLPLPPQSVDRVICFSAWPHFPDGAAAARELARVLKPGGVLDVMHIDSRATINGIHSGVGGAIGGDILPPAGELASLLERNGFRVRDVVDTDTAYRVAAERPA